MNLSDDDLRELANPRPPGGQHVRPSAIHHHIRETAKELATELLAARQRIAELEARAFDPHHSPAVRAWLKDEVDRVEGDVAEDFGKRILAAFDTVDHDGETGLAAAFWENQRIGIEAGMEMEAIYSRWRIADLEAERRWRPLPGEEPEFDSDVLVAIKGPEPGVTKAIYTRDARFICPEHGWEFFGVVAWQPLPPPPEVKRDE